jgi:ABC-2 type transport system ATP-binding protein
MLFFRSAAAFCGLTNDRLAPRAMILTEHLSRSFATKVALHDLNLRVEPGEILGLLGPNGAGKSTTVKILTGLLRPTSGRASVAGFDIVTQPLDAKQRLGYVPEQPMVYDTLTAAEFLEVVWSLHHLDPATAAARRDELLDLFGLADARDQRLSTFSKGMKQKVVLAAALIHRPDVLILDEPLDGLDANSARIVKELLRTLAAQGRTILFCSHILEVVERICTRIVIIDKGREIASGSPAAIAAATASPSLDDAFAKLTGVRDASQVTGDILRALGE